MSLGVPLYGSPLASKLIPSSTRVTDKNKILISGDSVVGISICLLYDVACHLGGTKRATTTFVLTENYDVVRRRQAWLASVRILIGDCWRF